MSDLLPNQLDWGNPRFYNRPAGLHFKPGEVPA
jgi:hypothetical protein